MLPPKTAELSFRAPFGIDLLLELAGPAVAVDPLQDKSHKPQFYPFLPRKEESAKGLNCEANLVSATSSENRTSPN